MDTVGIRELKAHLSRHLKRVQAGSPLVVTERGRAIARITPVASRSDAEWAHALVTAGHARWTGGKPTGAERPVGTARGQTVSSAVLEDRR